MGPFINFPCIRRNFANFCQLPVCPLDLLSTFRTTVVSFVHFCQLSVSVGHSVRFSCVCETFHQNFVLQRDLPSIFINFSCVHGTFHQLLSTFCLLLSNCPASGFRQLSVLLCFHAFCQLMSTLRVSSGTSVNFLCVQGTFCQLPSTFRASEGLSVKFCASRTFCHLQ